LPSIHCNRLKIKRLSFGKHCATLFMFLSSDKDYCYLADEATDAAVAFFEATA
jgi:hypothetical protein